MGTALVPAVLSPFADGGLSRSEVQPRSERAEGPCVPEQRELEQRDLPPDTCAGEARVGHRMDTGAALSALHPTAMLFPPCFCSAPQGCPCSFPSTLSPLPGLSFGVMQLGATTTDPRKSPETAMLELLGSCFWKVCVSLLPP